MSRHRLAIWKCDLCYHPWVAKDEVPPAQCPHCRKRDWHNGKDYTKGDLGAAPEPDANPRARFDRPKTVHTPLPEPVAPAPPETADNWLDELVPEPAPVSKAAALAALKAKLGLKTAADLERGESAKPPEIAAGPVRRNFNPNRKGWYEVLAGEDWGHVVKDRETGQFFVESRGQGQEYPTFEAAKNRLDFMGG